MKTIFTFLLVDMVLLNLYVFWSSGLSGLMSAVHSANGWGLLLFVDLALICMLAMGFMIRDARAQNRSALPYMLLTALGGSVGPLLYLVRRAPQDARS